MCGLHFEFVLFGWEKRDVAPVQGWRRGDGISDVSPSKELVIEGKATIRKRVAEVDEQYTVEFAHKPGATYERFVDSWGQNDPEKYLRDFNNRLAR